MNPGLRARFQNMFGKNKKIGFKYITEMQWWEREHYVLSVQVRTAEKEGFNPRKEACGKSF